MSRNLKSLSLGLAALVCALPALAGTLSDSPLFLQSAVPPNVLFSLSVEFPTANTAAYQGTNDYAETNTIWALFDPDKCYTYNGTNNWFSPAAQATSHACSGQWSGNFLNWASMTGLDEFRFAMTGGNRYGIPPRKPYCNGPIRAGKAAPAISRRRPIRAPQPRPLPPRSP